MTMPAYISKLRLLISVLAFLTMPAWAGFSWGAGCEGSGVGGGGGWARPAPIPPGPYFLKEFATAFRKLINTKLWYL